MTRARTFLAMPSHGSVLNRDDAPKPRLRARTIARLRMKLESGAARDASIAQRSRCSEISMSTLLAFDTKILAHLETTAPGQYQAELPLGARAPQSQATLF